MTKDWVHGVGHSSACQILLQIVVRAVITSTPPASTSSAWMLSTPADFPSFFFPLSSSFFSLHFYAKDGWSSSVSVWGQLSIDGSPLALYLYSSEQYSVHRFSISRSSVSHFPERSCIVVAFSCLTMIKFFTSTPSPPLLRNVNMSVWGAFPLVVGYRGRRNKRPTCREPEPDPCITMHATPVARDIFLANLHPSGPFTCISPKLLPSFSCVGFG